MTTTKVITKPPAGAEAPAIVRLSVNLAADVADVLRSLAGRRGLSLTETIRRAIAVLKFVEDEVEQGNKLAVVETGADGRQRVREIMLVG
ncbi:ribbon-helix-helix protein, CopG family [Kribbella sp. NPDC051620]|uniref:ribbon-helix-helix protein, CopG family n=1 Tax=Kribbella sp. NPDC051620 TaxID=3364120 RepID=UPI0037910465